MNYNDNTKALIWLNSFDMLSPSRRNKLLSLTREPSELYNNIEKYETEINHISDSVTYERLLYSKDRAYIDMLLQELDKYNIQTVGILDDNYPKLLKEIDTPPILLYCIGDTSIFNSRLMAVVGTRMPTRYGKDVTRALVAELVKYGFNIVSGLARGIDSIAHSTAYENESPQIAVMGCGLDYVYPAENRDLYEKIISTGGLIISEYRVGEKPLAYHFPERNRIISGISEGVLVTEAGENSGSLITVNCAVEQNRRVYIVPGNIYSKQSMGANEKLKQLQGALVTDISDILKDYNIELIDKEEKDISQLDIEENIILSALEKGDMHIEEIISITGLEINKLSSKLIKMELMGIIKKLHGNYYGV